MTMIDHRYAEINGIRMHYAISGTGRLIMFLHGFPEYWGVWKKQFAEFAKDYQVVAPDMRGYNLTEKPAALEKYHITCLVEDIRMLAEHLNQKKVFLVAEDWGAQVAWSFVLRHPEYVVKFVSINATHPALFNKVLQTDPDQQRASQYMLQLRSPQAEEMLTADDFAWLKKAVLENPVKQGLLTREDAKEWVAAWQQPGALTGGLNYYRASEEGPPDGMGSPGGSNLIDDLQTEELKVNVPTLLIYGQLETYRLPCSLVGLEEFVSRLTIKKIPDASHWVTIEKPDLLNAWVREFFELPGE
ncbi:MAG: alpha/beta hydrolase [Proteobacteria bacterium]|nr:alpha/beta hydrolase [Pseudomonadota bacterium]